MITIDITLVLIGVFAMGWIGLKFHRIDEHVPYMVGLCMAAALFLFLINLGSG